MTIAFQLRGRLAGSARFGVIFLLHEPDVTTANVEPIFGGEYGRHVLGRAWPTCRLH